MKTTAMTNKLYILCVKQGSKYNYEYVNRLYNMATRHCTFDFEFVCLTDDSTNIDKNITIIELPDYLQGWWCKPYIFSKDLPLEEGTVLYMDLDVVIGSSIDKLFTWNSNDWCIIRDYYRGCNPKFDEYNSSVIRFKYKELDYVWTEYKNNKEKIENLYHGDQDYFRAITIDQNNQAQFYPDSWLKSWRWDIKEFVPCYDSCYDEHNYCKLKDKEYTWSRRNKNLPVLERKHQDCCIAIFHGEIKPHEETDAWVIDNWK